MSLIEILDSDDDNFDFNFNIFGEGTKSTKRRVARSWSRTPIAGPSGIQEPGVQEGPVGTLHPKASLKPNTAAFWFGSPRHHIPL